MARKQRHGVRLGLINLDVTLHGVNQIFLNIFWRNRALGDFTQGDDRIFVVFALDGDRRSRGNRPRAVSGQEHELEPVRDFIDTIFNRHAGHGANTLLVVREMSL